MAIERGKQYDPTGMEQKWYDFWQSESLFVVDERAVNADKAYCVVMPPPNITGKLHLGHALDNTIQDVIIRYKRMCGFDVLWVPGTDHSAIATEAKIIAEMGKKGITKKDLGRTEFLKRAFEWKQNYGGQIVAQLKRLGCSCDWSKERFTMDDGCSSAVNHFFVDLYKRGLIYRGEKIVNWCPHCKTSISDAEVEYLPKDGSLWYINYEVLGEAPITIATTRPETMLGDAAIAVNARDERYAHLIGKVAILPLLGRRLPIVADDYVQTDFGTGVVKITPAHDPNDFEVGQRHNLETINVISEDGSINENGGIYKGLKVAEAREAIVLDLEAAGLIKKTETIAHNVGVCYRCAEVIEPRISKQWFVKMADFAGPAIKTVRDQEIKFVPERFSKTYFHWMENLKDWCISRQLWWGHRIPAYHCVNCGKIEASVTPVSSCSKCGGQTHQDADTLDTWFSAALWPFSVLGWPEQTKLLEKFFPTQVLVTGYDIIFFWVARMVFSSLDQLKMAPFRYVYIHGLVRDDQGRKMSKSLGNGIDPMQVIEENGADVLRMSLIIGTSPGNDMRFSEGKILLARNFANKLWNAARFVLMNVEEGKEQELRPELLKLEDMWVLTKLESTIKGVTDNIEAFEFGMALQKIYEFTWDVFCDWYIELAKPRIKNKDQGVCGVLVCVQRGILRLLHPFMPFITEELWQALSNSKSIALANWPTNRAEFWFEQQADDFEKLIVVIKAIRNARAETKISQNQKLEVYITTQEAIIKNNAEFIKALAGAKSVNFKEHDPENIGEMVAATTEFAQIFISATGTVDKEKERARLKKELQKAQNEHELLKERLANVNFLNKAPKNVIEEYRAQCEGLTEQIVNLKSSIKKCEKP